MLLIFFLPSERERVSEWESNPFLHRNNVSFFCDDERTKIALPSFANTNETLTNRSLWPCTIDNAQRMCVLCVRFFFSSVAVFLSLSFSLLSAEHVCWSVGRLLLPLFSFSPKAAHTALHNTLYVHNQKYLYTSCCCCCCSHLAGVHTCVYGWF